MLLFWKKAKKQTNKQTNKLLCVSSLKNSQLVDARLAAWGPGTFQFQYSNFISRQSELARLLFSHQATFSFPGSHFRHGCIFTSLRRRVQIFSIGTPFRFDDRGSEKIEFSGRNRLCGQTGRNPSIPGKTCPLLFLQTTQVRRSHTQAPLDVGWGVGLLGWRVSSPGGEDKRVSI